MDELSKHIKTVLLSCNCEFDETEFQVVKCDFGEAVNAVTAPGQELDYKYHGYRGSYWDGWSW